MTRILVWDLPTRLFHVVLSVGFLLAAAIAFLGGEQGRLFPYHSLIGLALALVVILRVVWGFVGSRYARFNSFLFGPREVVAYFTGVLSGRGRTYVGHNPGSAYAIVAMLVLTLGVTGTGVMLGAGSEVAGELHEVLVYLMLFFVGAHVLGVVLHTIRHRENITASMIHGWKAGDLDAGIRSTHVFAAGVGLLVAGAWVAALFGNFDSRSQSTTLPILGAVIQLGEAESEGMHGHAENRSRERRDD